MELCAGGSVVWLGIKGSFAGALTRGSFKTIPASEETTNTQRFEADSPADETVSGEPVSVWKFPAFRKMQGVFEKMQRGANCTRAQRGHFSITCIAFSLLEEQGGVIALAGTPRLPSGLGDSSTVEQWTRFHGRRNCPDGARAAQGVFLVQDQHRRASRRKSCRRRPLGAARRADRKRRGSWGKYRLDQKGRLPIEGK